ncbi:exodeoxyribonuclease VII small subunit [Nakamurella sp. UYEF19]|uniref:exodeoxyribonuclease VII small subunit n=1 Tax=Nakamurella sp. UYEF19 TaxID=1756392 RepID=UPI003394A3DC
MSDPTEPTEPTAPKAARTPAKKPKNADVDAPQSAAADTQAAVATYELARDELAAVVSKLESGGLSLDESLSLWERGEHLAGVCNRFLEGARERVEVALARADGDD